MSTDEICTCGSRHPLSTMSVHGSRFAIGSRPVAWSTEGLTTRHATREQAREALIDQHRKMYA